MRPAPLSDRRSTIRALNIHLSSGVRSSITAPMSSFRWAVASKDGVHDSWNGASSINDCISVLGLGLYKTLLFDTNTHSSVGNSFFFPISLPSGYTM